MRSQIIFARHGNTFGPTDTPVWVGARSDLPLVEKGLAQAHALAKMLQTANIIPDALITGPLQRTRQTAAIVAETLKLPVKAVCIDQRLTEIDYGTWEGKSTEALITEGNNAELEAWNKSSTFPASPGWQPSEAQLIANTSAILKEAITGTSVIITSNGILRFFARAALNANDFPDRKVATGHVCIMEYDSHANGWRITKWNQPPE